MKTGAIVLSGGSSVRMGTPKALLDAGGKTFIATILEKVVEAELYPICVVSGEHFEEIDAAIPKGIAIHVQNHSPELGQLSSLQIGLDTLGKVCDAVMMLLVDHPLVKRETLSAMLGAFEQKKGTIIIPSFRGRRGHPVIFAKEHFDQLRETPLDQGAKPVVRGNAESIYILETDDEGTIIDIDTPEDFKRHIGHVI